LRRRIHLYQLKLGMFVENRNDHNTIMVIGNVETGLWKKAFALASPAELVTIIRNVADDPAANAPRQQ